MTDFRPPASPDETATPSDAPRLTPRAEAALAERRAREAEALRANLRRRKQQSRERTDTTPDTPRKGSASCP
ncbi:hypothetical protein AA103196_0277 [Ameyamaea chiangmaiensis NBRC 103196]|uniref:hypothetical protein n=1 Tax=Ameyamaea chiangmaiensis TaxID=442969 RepID=UPI001BB07F53|nr:hypothetical protein [Ameyamaea chiangmaiensis]MBS4074673.1 hypothetical protein [Ameyamaea chiangmaiensis]GBQ62318.1 hypothetical protein AA103196_0277 [Ameyamaea chiangmaiensis NBRC 103196]